MTDVTPQDGLDRRRFLTVLGAAGAGAALTGCSSDRVAKLIPYNAQVEDQIPGVATYYASTCTECAAGCGLHVKTREGRAIKLEGNPAHPVNAGTICALGTSALQGLYNPARIKGPMKRGAGGFQPISWDEAIKLLAAEAKKAQGSVAVLSAAGPGTFSDLLSAWAKSLGGAVTHYEPFDREPVRLASKAVFGRDEVPAVDLASAKYVLSFGADFLETWGPTVEHQRGFAASHGFSDAQRTMAKHVYVAARAGLTGLNADEWLAPRPGSEAAVALAVANVLLSERSGAPADANALKAQLAKYTPEFAAQESGLAAADIQRIAREFASARPSLALAGGVGLQHAGAEELSRAVHLLNYIAGNVGETVRFGAELAQGDGVAATVALTSAMAAGKVKLLLVHGANPAFTLPKSAKFTEALAKVPFKVSTGLYLDETSSLCDLLLPNHHALERWDDLRPRAGVLGLMQPVMEPVFNTRHTGDVLLGTGIVAGAPASYEAHLKAQWAAVGKAHGRADADAFWRESLAKGGLFEAAKPVAPVKLAAGVSVTYTAPAKAAEGSWTFLAGASSLLHDGRGANRPWLLENPDPVTKTTWFPVLDVHPEDAKELDVVDGEIVKLTSKAGTIEAPIKTNLGIRRGVVSLPLGWGHTEYGQFATGRGANALDLLAAPAGGFVVYATDVSIEKTRGFRKLAKTEGTPRQLGRHIAEAMPVAHAAKGLTVKESYEAIGEPEEEINPEWEKKAIEGWREGVLKDRVYGENNQYAGEHPSWGMVVDLAKCTGCSACVTACYAENNIPWVGEEQVLRGREISWMRIERYWEEQEVGGKSTVEARFVPVMCQHCENAPCEPVCPVYAAYHTVDGLNGQVYNRCVGTRYCSNNCPYKVRYFNWRAYNKWAWPEPMHLQLNPEVTVRARGVMEKCTFCIQRIREAQHRAKLEDRGVRDGDVITACAQACPSGAIVFGDLHDPASRVVKAREASPRGYHVLEDINVRPAVTYLAKVVHRAAETAKEGHA